MMTPALKLREVDTLCRLIVSALFLLFVSTACAKSPSPETIRPPAVAGSFYPADARELETMVSGFVNKAPAVSVEGKLLALIAPHAGYIYSGHVAGHTYRQLQGQNIRTVILLGASHRSSFKGASVYADGAFRTPLGDAAVDIPLASRLVDPKKDVGFYPDPHASEHSLEAQIPFIQAVLGKKTKIVPILIGSPTQSTYEHLTEQLSDILARDPSVVLVTSTDLSHYHDYEAAVRIDQAMLEPLRHIGSEETRALLSSGKGEMCGSWPVIFTLEIMRKLGANQGVLYKYANSGDVTPDKGRVVGYAAVGFYRSPLTPDHRHELLEIAKQTIRSHVQSGVTPTFEVKSPMLRSNQGVFVTVNRQGRLRGCIGSLTPAQPLWEGVVSNAKRASTGDPRFPPMNPSELADMEVEVSVLSPFTPIDAADAMEKIRIGRDGLFLVLGNRSGVFLPQVPVEQGWDVATYLRELCGKAGLPDGAWKDKDAKLYIFQAEVIKEG